MTQLASAVAAFGSVFDSYLVSRGETFFSLLKELANFEDIARSYSLCQLFTCACARLLQRYYNDEQ